MNDPLEYPWSTYLELQSKLMHSHTVSGVTNAMEDGLNHILQTIEATAVPSKSAELQSQVDTRMSTSAWNERNHARLRRKFAGDIARSDKAESGIFAFVRIRDIADFLGAAASKLLKAIADGWTYDQISRAEGGAGGQLRTRVSRLRSRLRNH